MKPRLTIAAFDSFAAARGLTLEATVVGGAALALLGVTDRQTRDVDVIDPKLPEEVAEAARVFAQETRLAGSALADDWLNNGPIQLGDILPAGWRDRTRPAFEGAAVVLTALGQEDLLKTKLFALCDRGTDLPDCLALAPSAKELDEAEPWVAEQDANELWPEHVRATLADLRLRLGHGV